MILKRFCKSLTDPNGSRRNWKPQEESKIIERIEKKMDYILYLTLLSDCGEQKPRWDKWGWTCPRISQTLEDSPAALDLFGAGSSLHYTSLQPLILQKLGL